MALVDEKLGHEAKVVSSSSSILVMDCSLHGLLCFIQIKVDGWTEPKKKRRRQNVHYNFIVVKKANSEFCLICFQFYSCLFQLKVNVISLQAYDLIQGALVSIV